jgi:hypothetical protein
MARQKGNHEMESISTVESMGRRVTQETDHLLELDPRTQRPVEPRHGDGVGLWRSHVVEMGLLSGRAVVRNCSYRL